jgi:hypothetical protein
VELTVRAFTVEQANALIPALERALARLRERRDTIGERTDKLQVLDAIWGEKVMAPSNPDHGEFVEHRGEIAQALADIDALVTSEILGRGLRFPAGGLEHGLIDFPTTFEGRWVFLCWRSTEPCILAWHEIHGGFAGRRVLREEDAPRMGLPDDPALDQGAPLDL